jgi:hypothetical protein
MPEPTDKTEEQKAPEGVDRVLEELKNLSERIPAKAEEKPTTPVAPTYADRRATLQKSLGYNDEQMAAHEEMILRNQAPIIEQTGWSRLEKKSDLDNFRSDIEKELAIYPQERRTPELMEKIYYMVKGQKADSKPAGGSPSTRVERTRVSGGPGYNGADPGVGGTGDGGKSPEEDLDDKEKFVADKLGVGYKEYAQSKKVGREIRELRTPDSRPVNSLADVELRRMTGRR